MKTSLYRHFDADGALLYVGISLNHIARLGQHAGGSHWFRDIARVEIDHFETRAQAAAAETLAIDTENPRHNKVRGDGRHRGLAPHIARIEAILSPLSPSDRAGVFKLCAGAFGVADPTNPADLDGFMERLSRDTDEAPEIKNAETLRRWKREGFEGLAGADEEPSLSEDE